MNERFYFNRRKSDDKRRRFFCRLLILREGDERRDVEWRNLQESCFPWNQRDVQRVFGIVLFERSLCDGKIFRLRDEKIAVGAELKLCGRFICADKICLRMKNIADFNRVADINQARHDNLQIFGRKSRNRGEKQEKIGRASCRERV